MSSALGGGGGHNLAAYSPTLDTYQRGGGFIIEGLAAPRSQVSPNMTSDPAKKSDLGPCHPSPLIHTVSVLFSFSSFFHIVFPKRGHSLISRLSTTAEYITQNLPAGDESGVGDPHHHYHRSPAAPAVVTVAALQEALRSTKQQQVVGSAGSTGGRPVAPTVVILHPSTTAASFSSDKKLRVSLNIESVWAFLPGGSSSSSGSRASVRGAIGGGPSGAASQLGGSTSSAPPRVTMPLPFPSSLPPMPSQGGAATGYRAAASPPSLRAKAAEPAAAPTEPMTFDEGLPPFWSDPRQLDEARRLLLSAAELVWPPPSREGFSGGGTGGTDSIFRSFLCGQVAEHAIATGIEYHMQQLSSEGVNAGRMGRGGVTAVQHEPGFFVAQLAVAGQHAFDAWLQRDRSSGGGGVGGPGGITSELLSCCGCSTPEEAVERAVSAWQQQQQASQGNAAPLLQLVRVEEEGGGGGSSGAAPMVLVRLDVAGLLDLASSIRLAEELAMELLI